MTDRELLDRKGHEVNDDLPPLPDQYDAAAHMYPWDIEDLQTGEKTGVVFSIPVGCPDGKSVPLWTSEQMRAYARAAVLAERERCAKVCEAEAESLGSGGKRDAAALCCAADIRNGTT